MENINTNQNNKMDDTLILWKVDEFKKKYSKDRERIIFFVGGTLLLFSLFLKHYVFAVFVVIFTITIVFLSRKQPVKYTFAVTDEGVSNGDKIIPFNNLLCYNIVDVPGETSRLIMFAETKGFNSSKIVLPIYDNDVEKLEEIFSDKEIERYETIRLSLLDNLVNYF